MIYPTAAITLKRVIIELLIEIVIAVNFLYLIVFQNGNNWLVGIFCVIFGLVLLSLRFSSIDLISSILASLIGPAGDILSSETGVWIFSNNIFLGIPPWLPISWAASFLLFRRLGQSIGDLLKMAPKQSKSARG